jgi:hypothetical protein
MNEKSKALHFADQLDGSDTLCTAPDILGAAAELRRLDEVERRYEELKASQNRHEPVAVVAMDVSRIHLSYGEQCLGQKPDTKIAMLLKDLPVGTQLYTVPARRKWVSLSEYQINSTLDFTTERGVTLFNICRIVESLVRELNDRES